MSDEPNIDVLDPESAVLKKFAQDYSLPFYRYESYAGLSQSIQFQFKKSTTDGWKLYILFGDGAFTTCRLVFMQEDETMQSAEIYSANLDIYQNLDLLYRASLIKNQIYVVPATHESVFENHETKSTTAIRALVASIKLGGPIELKCVDQTNPTPWTLQILQDPAGSGGRMIKMFRPGVKLPLRQHLGLSLPLQAPHEDAIIRFAIELAHVAQ